MKDENYNKLIIYLNNQTPSNIMIKNDSDFNLNDEILENNKLLCKEKETGYYYFNYHEKVIYICTNCVALKKDRRSLLQHTKMRNKCPSRDIKINTLDEVEALIQKQNIKLYNCNKCDTYFKTTDHYTRHITINCPNNNM